MKLIVLLMMAFLLQVSLSGKSQTVSLSGEKVSLKEILANLKTQTGLFFFYDASILDEAKPVSVELKNVPLETALNEIFKTQPMTWVLEDKTVTIVRNPGATSGSSSGSGQPSLFPVKGIITDNRGTPIPGVSVMLKGSKQGTVSDKAGGFTIMAELKNVLLFSSINYSSKELKVDKNKMIVKLEMELKPMESLLVGGNMYSMKRKADATSVTVLDAKTLEKIPLNTIDQVFRGWVPGTNSFDVGGEPEGFPTLSIRGAGSSTSLSTIAVYIDGIEYAGGSGYLSQLDKSNIDRIEIVRGPGAATMYGTGSNGGIVQIFTKKAMAGQTAVRFATSAGYIKSKWVEKNPFQQLHNLETTVGFNKVALTLGGSFRTADAYKPGGGDKNKGFYTGINFRSGKLQVNFLARYNVRKFGLPRNPIFDTAVNPRRDILIELGPGDSMPAYEFYRVIPSNPRNKNGITTTQITGINLSHKTSAKWVNNLDVGFTSNNGTEVPIYDTATPLQRQYFSTKADITTVRYSNVYDLSNGSKGGVAAIISSGAEYKKYSYSSTITRATSVTIFRRYPDNENYAAFAQLNPSYKNVYLTMGVRYEKNNLFKAAWNPRLGLTTNFDVKTLIVKPRISWGKGITPPQYEERFGSPPGSGIIVYANPDLKPQSQQGFDYGVEIYNKKGTLKFEAVHYDNILKDMIAENDVGLDTVTQSLAAFMYVNVGRVSNRGWEFSGYYQHKRFDFQLTFSIMNTTIADSTGTYLLSQLKLAPGTRLVNLPKHTAGLNITYHYFKLFGKEDKGSLTFNLTEVDGVKSLDFANYALDVSYGRTPFDPDRFGYSVENSPVFRAGLYAEYYPVKDLNFFVQGSNIFNSYKYEYSSQYPTHGAAWLFGLKYSFSKTNN